MRMGWKLKRPGARVFIRGDIGLCQGTPGRRGQAGKGRHLTEGEKEKNKKHERREKGTSVWESRHSPHGGEECLLKQHTQSF